MWPIRVRVGGSNGSFHCLVFRPASLTQARNETKVKILSSQDSLSPYLTYKWKVVFGDSVQRLLSIADTLVVCGVCSARTALSLEIERLLFILLVRVF